MRLDCSIAQRHSVLAAGPPRPLQFDLLHPLPDGKGQLTTVGFARLTKLKDPSPTPYWCTMAARN